MEEKASTSDKTRKNFKKINSIIQALNIFNPNKRLEKFIKAIVTRAAENFKLNISNS